MSWCREKVLSRLREVGVVPIVRVSNPDDAFKAVGAVVAGGVPVVEITMGVPNALRVMEQVVEQFGESVLLGAGTVLDPETCRAALLSGAEFIVTPSLDVKVIETSRRYSKACIPGALTPTEIVTAWQAGADMVKVFPCGPVGGPNYLRSLRGPLPQIDFVPTGGVDLGSTADYIRAGAAAVAVGGELVSRKALQEGKTEVITANARQFLEAVRSARAELKK
ncbi:MAG: bifunctional 4-hydroxy-2-oxoglutarate aldolase/2-dehydro-3-deoxy-phosphogluconate aldolase [Acidobacteria bacterium]|nr:MAG: bifunctional 4-hydroxy-2-oxoglutarate aldolase/2-dehydro-3-deoxy-phosphogluconate aldolase [Acidobacteriota bacterium]